MSGTTLCSCPNGFIDGDKGHCDTCEEGRIGEHCANAFIIHGAKNIAKSLPSGTDLNGLYACHGKPAYQKGGGGRPRALPAGYGKT
jgi:hypothetical protein